MKIDDEFGDGYAKEHHELVACFMDVACKNFNNSLQIKYKTVEKNI